MLLSLPLSFIFLSLLVSLPYNSSRPSPKLTFSLTSIQHIQNTGKNQLILNKNLAIANIGSHVPGISNIKKHLSLFGYLPFRNASYDDTFDTLFESALLKYQQNLGLPITGKLDSITISQMITPRCGVPDKVQVSLSPKHYVHFPGKPRWSGPMPITLTYALSKECVINNLSLSDIKEALKRAFSRWASVIPVSFVETEDCSFADIKIGFYSGDHGDGEPFDGVLGVLAHSFAPEIGRFHLDSAETWAVDFRAVKSAVAIDLESVATHEIGHLLGLSHSPVKEAVMYPSLKPRDKKADLKLDDIEGVQALYGSNPNFTFGSLLESDTTANEGFRLRTVCLKLLILSTLAVSFHLS